MITYAVIEYPEELNMLQNKYAVQGNLSFSFSPKYLARLKQALIAKNAFQLFAKTENGEVAGHIASSKGLLPDYQWIQELFVEPPYQQQGIGQELIRRVIAFAKNHRLTGVITETEWGNTPAQKLYEKMGFVKIDNPSWKDGPTYKLHFKI